MIDPAGHFSFYGVMSMLVLERKVDQKIAIGSDITIQVVKVMGNRVRIGIKAPGDLRISRVEADVPLGSGTGNLSPVSGGLVQPTDASAEGGE